LPATDEGGRLIFCPPIFFAETIRFLQKIQCNFGQKEGKKRLAAFFHIRHIFNMIAGSQPTKNGAPQTAEMRNKSGFAEASAKGGGRFRKIIVWFLDEIQFQVPVGYEDAEGFHFGAEQASRRVEGIPAVEYPVEICACESDEFCCLT
jgi:hypothetical protein